VYKVLFKAAVLTKHPEGAGTVTNFKGTASGHNLQI
jgi:hypothetical protein